MTLRIKYFVFVFIEKRDIISDVMLRSNQVIWNIHKPKV